VDPGRSLVHLTTVHHCCQPGNALPSCIGVDIAKAGGLPTTPGPGRGADLSPRAMSGFRAWLAVTDGTMGSNFCLLRVEEMTF
jgi:hypothetical protein